MKRNIICIFLALLVLTGSASAFELRAEDEGFTLIASNEQRALLMDEKTLQLRLVDIPTGKTWNTSVMNGQQGNKTIKNTQKAAVLATFISNAQNATTNTLDSYSMSLKTENYEWKMIENGVEIIFTIGEDTFIIDDLPKAIRADKYMKMEEEAGWSSKQSKTFRDNYRAVKLEGLEQEYMIRVKDDSLSVMLIEQLYGIIFDSGVYTQADMEEDNAAVGYVCSYLPEIRVPVRYVLDGEELLFTIPCDELDFTENNEIIALDVLPYFLAADNTQEGYMLVPDGSGALIYLNNGKLSATAYNMPVYGDDALINADDYVSPRDPVALPVYAIKRTDGAMIAMIEEGAEISEITAMVSGRSDEFNRISSKFTIREIENVSLAGNESVTSPRYSSDIYQGDITIRYRWLTDENTDYVDIARAYREYLVNRGMLVPREAQEEAPFYMEVLGAARKDKFFLGIPYSSSVSATSIDQAEVIYEQAREAGIRNIHMMYSGLFRGGIKNSSLSRLKMDAQVGDTKALTALADLLRDHGDMLYPGVYWGRVHGEYAFNKLSQAARKHDGDPAQMYVFGESILKRSRTDHPAYLLAPGYLIRYTEKVMKNLEGLQLDGINLFDVGNTPVGDHKRNANVSRISAISTFEKTLEQIGGKYALILDNPLLYAFRYTTDATNLPDGDNGFAITDASIPFLQWVLDGSLSYSSASWNVESYLGIRQHLLWAMESKSSPRFTFTWEEPSVYANTEDADYLAYFSVQYEDCLSVAAECYQEYNAYYQLVKDAQVVAHQIYDNGVRTVTYDNGVQVYLNYGKTDAVVEGVSVSAGDYVIKEGV